MKFGVLVSFIFIGVWVAKAYAVNLCKEVTDKVIVSEVFHTEAEKLVKAGVESITDIFYQRPYKDDTKTADELGLKHNWHDMVNAAEVRNFQKFALKLRSENFLETVATLLNSKGFKHDWLRIINLHNFVHLQRLRALLVMSRVSEGGAPDPFFKMLMNSQLANEWMQFFFENDRVVTDYLNGDEFDFLSSMEKRRFINQSGLPTNVVGNQIRYSGYGMAHSKRFLVPGEDIYSVFKSADTEAEIKRRMTYWNGRAEEARVESRIKKNARYDELAKERGWNFDIAKLDLLNDLKQGAVAANEQWAILREIFEVYQLNPFFDGFNKIEKRKFVNAVLFYTREMGILDTSDGVDFDLNFIPTLNDNNKDIVTHLESIIKNQNPFLWLNNNDYSFSISGAHSRSQLKILYGESATRKIFWRDNRNVANRKLNEDIRMAANYMGQNLQSLEVFAKNIEGEWKPLMYEVKDGQIYPIKEVLGIKTEKYCATCHVNAVGKFSPRPYFMKTQEDYFREFNFRPSSADGNGIRVLTLIRELLAVP